MAASPSSWTDQGLPILRAILRWSATAPPTAVLRDTQLAELAGRDRHDPQFLRALRDLIVAGLVEADELRTQESYEVMVRGLTPAGPRATGEWPSEVGMDRLNAKKQARAAFMYRLYELTDGTFNPQDVHQVGESIGLSREDAEDTAEYLEQEALIKFVAELGRGGLVVLTHPGVIEVEQSLSHPQQPTSHFPPSVTVNLIHGDVVNSQVQQASPHAQQMATWNATPGEVATLVSELRSALQNVELDDAENTLVAASLDVAEKNAARTDAIGKRAVWQALRSVRSILEGTVASGAYLELAHLIHALPT